MSKNERSSIDWTAALPWLQCPKCHSNGSLERPSGYAFVCDACQNAWSVRDEILDVMDDLRGNNKVTADFYDGQNWKQYQFWKRFTPFNERAVTKWRAEVLQHLPDLSGTRLLDVAIGDGRNLPSISKSCDVFGIDVSIAQLQNCRSNHPDRQLWLLRGEAEKLPFRDNVFDNVLSFGAFNYFNDPLGGLREMVRVVKPDGLIVITDEYADLPDRMIGHRIGWPALDRWILRSLLHLGADFTNMIDRHRDLKIAPIMEAALRDWKLEDVCDRVAYCVVGRKRVGWSFTTPH